ncbi:hypothetical protein J437_LFUL009156 [Ladona fulva]|uniref:Uncharacterized protein n=1 Tax=Ladona fulva TaxID=123851 RepID=A0A8K0KJS5_LADFU|nr:hypothetical protein J437_LFUL009156 [Ladona fulva]
MDVTSVQQCSYIKKAVLRGRNAREKEQGIEHALAEVQQWVQYASCSNHLARWQQKGDQFLPRSVTIDECLAQAYEPEVKRQSAERRYVGSPRKQEFHQNHSSIRLMMIVAIDIIVSHSLLLGRTATAAYRRDFLQREVRHGVREKHRDLLESLLESGLCKVATAVLEMGRIGASAILSSPFSMSL